MITDLEVLKSFFRVLDLRVPDKTTEEELPRTLLVAVDEFNDRHDKLPPKQEQPTPKDHGESMESMEKGNLQFSGDSPGYSSKALALMRDTRLGEIAKVVSKLRRMGLKLPPALSAEQFLPVLTAACRALVRCGGELKPISSRVVAEPEPEPAMQMSAGGSRRRAARKESDQEATAIADQVWGRRPKPAPSVWDKK